MTLPESIPSDSVISLRAGSVRRQYAVEKIDRPFRFPCKLEDCGALKVDVLRVVATGKAICHGGAAQYDVKLQASEPCRDSIAGTVSLAVRAMDSASIDEAGREEKATVLKAACESYLETHGVLQMMQSLLQGIMKEKPSDPFAYMAEMSIRRSEENRSRLPSSEPEREVEAGAQATHDSDLEVLKRQVHEALVTASADGRLAAVLMEASEAEAEADPSLEPRGGHGVVVEELKAEDLRQQAKAALIKSCLEGHLNNLAILKLGEKERQEGSQPDRSTADELKELARDKIALQSQVEDLQGLVTTMLGELQKVKQKVDAHDQLLTK